MAVSSVTAERNTRQNPAASPGAINGSVTRRKASIRPHPSDRATSWSPIGAWATEASTQISASGKNRMA